MHTLQEAKDVGDEFLALEKFVNLNYLVRTLPLLPPSNSWITWLCALLQRDSHLCVLWVVCCMELAKNGHRQHAL